MEKNIEVKDVQKTEYLDKNGLDMLWAKVKENTNNQVEEECNRAQAVEGDITNKLDNLKYMPYVSKTNMNSSNLGDFVRYQLGATEFIISAQHGSNDARTEFGFGNVNFISRSEDSAVDIDYEGITVGIDNNIQFTNTGIRKYINRNTPAGSATEAFSTNGGVIDTTVFALKSELDSYAKKTDIPEIDTSDFVSKTTTSYQIIKSELGLYNSLYFCDKSNDAIMTVVTDKKVLVRNPRDVSSGATLTGQSLSIKNENRKVLTVTSTGISSSDNNADYVFATDGSIADLTQYAKKSEITAGSNVDDVQVNSVSVVENKIANIKPATKEKLGVVKVGDGLNVTDGTISVDTTAIGTGNYIPYARYEDDDYIMHNDICTERNGIKSRIGRNGLSVYKMTNNGIHSNIQCAEIELQSDKNRVRINDDGIDAWELDDFSIGGISKYLFGLSKRGVTLYGGDDNHVLTSNGSTIDITQYVLKSVYDEKIAALEARIAVLEAKHAEAT